MAKWTEQRRRLEGYRELSEIVGAMKNMAQVELHRAVKASRFHDNTFATTATALSILTQMNPELLGAAAPGPVLLVLIGSERGFCGGFNDLVAKALAELSSPYDILLVLGNRLAEKLPRTERLVSFSGPTTTDEILPCCQQALDYLLQQKPRPSKLSLLSHGQNGVAHRSLLPRDERPSGAPLSSLCLHLPPMELYQELQWHCLQQGLLRALFTSLKAENRFRLQQMEGASEHLEKLSQQLRMRLNVLRQQEIVEEIEMMLIDQSG